MSKSNLVDQLRNQIRSVETAGRISDEVRISSGCAAIDRLLPGNGYQRGTLVQWLTGGGHGADYLSLLAARQACADGGALVVFDPLNQFYPPAVAAIGINLDNLIVLRSPSSDSPTSSRHRSLTSDDTSGHGQSRRSATSDISDDRNDLLWSIDQALRCPAVAAVWGPMEFIDERWFRRFQLSAESSGCLGLFVQPIRAARQPSWAEVQWIVSHDVTAGNQNSCTSGTQDKNPTHTWDSRPMLSPAVPSALNESNHQQVRLQLTRCRGTQTGKTVNLSINTITGNVQPARRDHESHQRNRIGKNQTTRGPIRHSAG